MTAMRIFYDGSRQLQVDFGEGQTPYLIIASSETSGPVGKNSKTWNVLNEDGKRVRIQIQEFK